MKIDLESVLLNAPDFETLRLARLAEQLYAPLGTKMTLGQYVRLIQMFANEFAKKGRFLKLNTSAIFIHDK